MKGCTGGAYHLPGKDSETLQMHTEPTLQPHSS